MRGDLTETFRMINGMPYCGRYFFSLFFIELRIYCQGRFQKLSQLTNGIILLIKFNILGKKVLNPITNSNRAQFLSKIVKTFIKLTY